MERAFCKRLKYNGIDGVLLLQGMEQRDGEIAKEVARALIFVADFDFWKGGMTEGRCPIRQSWRIHNRGQRQKGNKQY